MDYGYIFYKRHKSAVCGVEREHNADGIRGDCMKNSKHFVASETLPMYIMNRWAVFQEKHSMTLRTDVPEVFARDDN